MTEGHKTDIIIMGNCVTPFFHGQLQVFILFLPVEQMKKVITKTVIIINRVDCVAHFLLSQSVKMTSSFTSSSTLVPEQLDMK